METRCVLHLLFIITCHTQKKSSGRIFFSLPHINIKHVTYYQSLMAQSMRAFHGQPRCSTLTRSFLTQTEHFWTSMKHSYWSWTLCVYIFQICERESLISSVFIHFVSSLQTCADGLMLNHDGIWSFVVMRRRVTSNHYKGDLNDQIYRMMKHFCPNRMVKEAVAHVHKPWVRHFIVVWQIYILCYGLPSHPDQRSPTELREYC